MPHPALDSLTARIASLGHARRAGRVSRISGGAVYVEGLPDAVALGDIVDVTDARGQRRKGEVIGLDPADLPILTDNGGEGLQVGSPVVHLGPPVIAPDDSWLGRVLDPYGAPLDGRPLLPGSVARPLRAAPPPATNRRALGARLETGLAAFNTLLPLVRGQRIGLFAGSGVGKSTLLGDLTRGVDADLTVIALIGERGREVREFVDRVLGPAGMARAVVVAATSDRSALERRRAAWAAMSVAEHFRDQGAHVLFLADSVTRFAEAHREIALAAGESAALRGFPPSLVQTIMSLAERAGPGTLETGDITAVFSVLVAGSDMEEPVADILRGVLDGHVVMDRAIAERGRFPAIDLLRSVSRALPHCAGPAENALIARARGLLGAYDRAEMMIRAGLYAKGSDPMVDAAIRAWPGLDGFLGESEPEDTAASFARLKGLMEAAEALTPAG